MVTVHAMCGIQGSGKTTLSKQLAIDYNAALYCYDALPKGHWSNDAHPAMYERIAQDLSEGRTVVCDDLHTLRKNRQALLNALHSVECLKVLHVMQTPLDVCLEHNRSRDRNTGRLPDWALLRCHNRYEPPTLDEGWDEIIYHQPI